MQPNKIPYFVTVLTENCRELKVIAISCRRCLVLPTDCNYIFAAAATNPQTGLDWQVEWRAKSLLGWTQCLVVCSEGCNQSSLLPLHINCSKTQYCLNSICDIRVQFLKCHKIFKCDMVLCFIMITQRLWNTTAIWNRGAYSYWHSCHERHYSRKFWLVWDVLVESRENLRLLNKIIMGHRIRKDW